jgi:hypothetical protein
MARRTSSRTRRGYKTLLNLSEQPHWTVFLTDFQLPERDVRSIKAQLKNRPTRTLFLTIDSAAKVLGALRSAGVNLDRDYVSLQGVVFRHRNVLRLHDLLEQISRADLARIELPLPECGFQSSFASELLRMVMNADYDEQELFADEFFRLLETVTPYKVTVKTKRSTLTVADRRQWFDLTGHLRQRELRILPAGEVSYTGDSVSGAFVIDGAIIPFPEHPSVANEANILHSISRGLRNDPIRMRVRQGRVADIEGNRRAVETFSRLFDRDERYRNVTEVGIAFNRECSRFIYDWPAASNESRPGVHLGIGGDPSPDDEAVRGKPLVHIDCVAGNCEVFVNRIPFLRASL